MAITIDSSTGSISGVTQPMGVGAAVASTDALQNAQGIGYNATPVSKTIVSGTTYTNTYGKPIVLMWSNENGASSCMANQVINGVAVIVGSGITTAAGSRSAYSCVIPTGGTYSVTYTGTLNAWELR